MFTSKIVFEMLVLDKMTGTPKMPKSDINTLSSTMKIQKIENSENR